MSDKQRSGLLKDGDNDYLGMRKDDYPGADSAWYKGKERLRRSIIRGISDFTDIQQELDEWNWPKLIDGIEENETEVRSGIRSAIAFFYEIHESMGWDFRRTLWIALEEAYTHGVTNRNLQNRIVEGVEFTPELREPDDANTKRREIEEKLEARKPLTDAEIGWIAKHDLRLFEKWNDREMRESQLRWEERTLEKYSGESDRE